MRDDEIKEIDRRIKLKNQHIGLLKVEIDDLEMSKKSLMELKRQEYEGKKGR